jgi:MFS superfamily sulfate permease-like transporter
MTATTESRGRRFREYLPVLEWLPRYDRSWIRGDVIAAATVWALVVPQAIAYAQIAGLPPQAELFATFAGLLGYALFGTSRQIIVSPTSCTAAISAAIVGTLALGDAARNMDLSFALALLVGLSFIAFGMARVGFISRFIAPAVQAGFMFGLGLTIMIGQVPKLLGISEPQGDFFPKLWQVIQALPQPRVQLEEWLALLPGALAISVIGFAETITVADDFAEKHKYEIRPNQELVAVGAANVFSGFFQGFITGGGASQSAANDDAGARSQLVSIVVSGLTVLTLLFLLPLFSNLPQAVLGAIVINAVIGFLNVKALRRIASLRKDSFYLALLALASVLLLGILPGLIIAVVVSMLLILGYLARPETTVLGQLPGTNAFVSTEDEPTAAEIPGLLIYRLEAPLMNLNAKRMRDRLRLQLRDSTTPIRVVLLDLDANADLDIQSLDILSELHNELQTQGTALWLTNLHGAVRSMLERGGLAQIIGSEHLYRSVDAGVRNFQQLS